MAGAVRRMKDAPRRSGSPSCEDRIASLEAMDHALVAHQEAIAAAIARDFGSRSRHETLFAEVFLVHSAIQHAKGHLRDGMEPEDRKTGWKLLPARAELRP